VVASIWAEVSAISSASRSICSRDRRGALDALSGCFGAAGEALMRSGFGRTSALMFLYNMAENLASHSRCAGRNGVPTRFRAGRRFRPRSMRPTASSD